MKLLAKMPEERYQTARGLQRDLARCLDESRQRPTDDRTVPAGPSTTSRIGSRSRRSSTGATRERAALLQAFERVRRRRRPDAGPGVRLLGHRQVRPGPGAPQADRPRARASSCPASSISTSATSPTPRSSRRSRSWCSSSSPRARSGSRRGGSGCSPRSGSTRQLIIDVLPSVELVIGPQPAGPRAAADRGAEPVPPGAPALRRRVRPARSTPLALFLDDLQWADSASLGLLQELVHRSPPARHLPRDRRLPRQRGVAGAPRSMLALDEMRADGGADREHRARAAVSRAPDGAPQRGAAPPPRPTPRRSRTSSRTRPPAIRSSRSSSSSRCTTSA